MNQFLLVFRGVDDDGDQSEYRFTHAGGEPMIDGRLVVDGETYTIRGVDWLVRKDDSPSEMPRFVCTLVVGSADETRCASPRVFKWSDDRPDDHDEIRSSDIAART